MLYFDTIVSYLYMIVVCQYAIVPCYDSMVLYYNTKVFCCNHIISGFDAMTYLQYNSVMLRPTNVMLWCNIVMIRHGSIMLGYSSFTL